MSISPSKAWELLFDSISPEYVCETFLPPKKRGKPGRSFNNRDFHFFAPSVIELSELFTIERQQNRLIHHYFDLPRFQSAYLLYYFPLQAFKFFQILTQNSEVTKKSILGSNGTLKVLDLGAGPGTASFGFLQALLALGIKIPPIEFYWIDQNQKIMEHGQRIFETFAKECSEFFEAPPKLEPRRTDLFQKRRSELPKADWILSGNFFNEEKKDSVSLLRKLMQETKAKHILSVEPAMKFQAQALSALRNEIFEDPETAKIWSILSPCLHHERCPLSMGRDWCHFSEPVKIPGRCLRAFSETLGSERSFLKYSHLWLSQNSQLVDRKVRSSMRRVVSDPMRLGNKKWKLLLCRPETSQNFLIDSIDRPRVHRGDLIRAPHGIKRA